MNLGDDLGRAVESRTCGGEGITKNTLNRFTTSSSYKFSLVNTIHLIAG